MSNGKLSIQDSPRKSFFWLLVSFLAATVLLLSSGAPPVSAAPFEPPDDTLPVEPGEPPEFVPYTNGFDWAVPNRFGRDDNRDGLIDYHWDSASMKYDDAVLYPDVWPMIFDGCRTEADAETGVSSTNTYTWVLNGETIYGRRCKFTYSKDLPYTGKQGFAAQGTYPVTLTVTYGEGVTSPTGQNPETFHQDVVVRDILIVSLGDSTASGEGNPDIPQRFHIVGGFPVWDADPVWQDRRCHRSAKAGAAQAALNIERMDPKTTVTFISFACSGATIDTQLFDNYDVTKSRGWGVLGPYKGAEAPSDFEYYHDTGDWSKYIPSQIWQLQDALIPPEGKTTRQIDALIFTGGGNDMHFSDITTACVLSEFCYDLPMIEEDPRFPLNAYSPRQIVDRALARTPGRPIDNVPFNLQKLAEQIHLQINPNPTNVYVTQYYDLVSDDNGNPCRMMEDIFWPNPLLVVEPWEAAEAAEDALGSLNTKIYEAAENYKALGWVYVDGLASYKPTAENPNGTPGLFYRHGYCATDNWIRRAEESELIQGPLYWRAGTWGTGHANYDGHHAYSTRLLFYMLPNLYPQPPANPPEIGAPIYAIGSLVDQAGTNGWYIRSCQAGVCYPKVVMQVIGTAEVGVAGAGVTVDGVDACTLSGVTCRTDGGLSGDKKQYTWNIELAADGIYRFQFTLFDNVGATVTGGTEVKVDLHDPTLQALGPFTVDEGGSVELIPAVEDNEGSPVSYLWDLNNDGDFETYDQKPIFSAEALDGPVSQTIQVKAIDQAGRTDTAEIVIDVVNVEPSPEITSIPEINPEGTAMTFGAIISDPGVNDTFAYAWSVSQGETVLATGTDPEFHFTPPDNGSYAVSLKVTDDDGGEGSASQTFAVVNVAPELSDAVIDPAVVDEGGNVSISGILADPGIHDNLTVAINWGDGSAEEIQSYPAGNTQFTANHTYADDDPSGTAADDKTITIKITDQDSGSSTLTSTITVQNLPPAVTLTGPASGALYRVNDPVNLAATVTDNANDTLSCSVDWDDGSTSDGMLAEGICSAGHAFAAAGVYTVRLTALDDDSGSEMKSVLVVVYDPSAGFVTGGGWIDSPAGAYIADPALTGQAQFGFVSRYQKGAALPSGRTHFQFEAGDFTFTSDTYEWLVVNQNGSNAQFKGSGLINAELDGNGNAYHFMLWAGDGSVDTFRIKIWWEGTDGAENVVYDNGVDQELGGGSIVVHTSK